MIPSKVSVVLVVSEMSLIDVLIVRFVLRSRWLLPGLSLRWLYSNQIKSSATYSSAMTDLVLQGYGFVSSAQLAILVST